MKSFDVLNRNLNIHKNYLLEASAGTGKTFSIENIVTRLLIENDPQTNQATLLEHILVVTFTRAATRDLKSRIRSQLEKSLSILHHSSKDIPDYLQSLIDQGDQRIQVAIRNLETALATFDQAQIYTIHGFCLRMLTQFVFESDFNMQIGHQEEKSLKKEDLILLIRDFFRTEIHEHIFSAEQLRILLKYHENSIENLQEALLKRLNADYEILPTPDFASDFQVFCSLMQDLKAEYHLQPEKMLEDFDRQIPYYKSIKNKQPDAVRDFISFFHQDHWSEKDFNRLIRDGLLICEYLSPENVNLKKIKQLPEKSSLHYPDLISQLSSTLGPLVKRASSEDCIFARMAHACQKLMQKYLSEEEKHRESDLLKQMLKAIENPQFVTQVRNVFRTVIIDEFQDTDPIQWTIFQRLFLNNPSCKIYLVGDPKQSIYAFRQADIYTYLTAANSLGTENHASLNTNYRSQPSLVHGLNTLFQACKDLFPLPASNNNFLEYPPVQASPFAEKKKFQDEHGCIHFFYGEVSSLSNQSEEELFFPFMAQEIQRLHTVDGLRYKQFAVLIKDKFQGQRLAQYFERHHIPYHLQRQRALTESIAWDSLQELLSAILHPKNESLVKIALGGPIIGWTADQIKSLNLDSAVQGTKAMQDFELESLLMGAEHSQKVKAAPIKSDYGSKDYVDLVPSTAESRLNDSAILESIVGRFYSLHYLLSDKGFPSFFQTFMQSSWQENQLTIAQSLLEKEKGELFYDELQQIAALLMEHEIEHPGGPEQLLAFLQDYKKMPLEDDERLKKFSDPLRDAVSILTTHNSKGLEYDIVFAFGLVNRVKSPDTLIPIRDGIHQRLVTCLEIDSPEYLQYCEELDAEKMRQLYVAMTRAKYRLYVPIAILTKQKALGYGCASPIELFLARLGQEKCSYTELYQRIETIDISRLTGFLENHPQSEISYSLLNNATFSIPSPLSSNSVSLTTPEHVQVPGEKSFIQSFTSLSKQKKTSHSKSAPYNFENPEKTIHTLPSGNITGQLIHKILEHLPFSQFEKIFSKEELKSWIEPFVKDTDFMAWIDILCEMIYQILHTPLRDFSFKNLKTSHLYRETEFLYPYEKELVVEGLQWQKGFLKGVIDLFFYHEGFYYIVDWKSNWLGINEEAYTQENMHLSMLEHDYYFQAHIYKEALKRYLKLVDNRPFEEIYGGCFYIFVRGLNHGKQTGIYEI